MSQLAPDTLMFACLFLKNVKKYFILLSGAFPFKGQRSVPVWGSPACHSGRSGGSLLLAWCPLLTGPERPTDKGTACVSVQCCRPVPRASPVI